MIEKMRQAVAPQTPEEAERRRGVLAELLQPGMNPSRLLEIAIDDMQWAMTVPHVRQSLLPGVRLISERTICVVCFSGAVLLRNCDVFEDLQARSYGDHHPVLSNYIQAINDFLVPSSGWALLGCNRLEVPLYAPITEWIRDLGLAIPTGFIENYDQRLGYVRQLREKFQEHGI